MKSQDRDHLYAHEGSGDIKVTPETPGVNVLPDGNVAITAAAVADMAKLSEAAKHEKEQGA